MVRYIYEQSESGEMAEYPSFTVYAPDTDSMSKLYYTCVAKSETIWVAEIEEEILFHINEDEYDYAIIMMSGDVLYQGDSLPKMELKDFVRNNENIVAVCEDKHGNSQIMSVKRNVEKNLLLELIDSSQKIYFNDIYHEYEYSEVAYKYLKETGLLENSYQIQPFVFELEHSKYEVFFISDIQK